MNSGITTVLYQSCDGPAALVKLSGGHIWLEVFKNYESGLAVGAISTYLGFYDYGEHWVPRERASRCRLS